MNSLLATYAAFPLTMTHGLLDQVWADDGRVFWDFYGGHCVASTGHCHPSVVAAIQAQAQQLIFYSTAGRMQLREQAADALMQFAQWQDGKVFFCNSGAEANENALKLAHKLTGRARIMSVQGGWHGRSLTCLAATDDAAITTPYQSWLPAAGRLPLNDLAALASVDWRDVAAVIIEPIQSLAGMRSASIEFLTEIRQITRANGTLLIFDEIQTGVARLGVPFFGSELSIRPDIITSAKGLASGVPIGAVLMSDAIAQQLKAGDMGSTFGGGPLAMAALLATLQVIDSEGLAQRAIAIERCVRSIAASHGIRVRGQGALLGLETPVAGALKQHLIASQILVGGSNDAQVLRLMPPLNLTDAALSALQQSIDHFFSQPR